MARDVTREKTYRIARRGVGWVPEERRIVPSLTVRRNLEIAQKSTRFRAWTLAECCEIFSALGYLLERESRIFPAARCRWWPSRAHCSAAPAWC